ncbi:helix-turn-helix transcriptional regulator [Microtetraspora sp. NBRC 16547]|uniref:helix-turn-helix domain-containing protein n=1 Tax=Microtetraspora sp. NBRC 16547 TaxID=3030993 RepID=UPI0024A176FD|nr:helix-turn-helix transcriptional regulator [Microtetraspora sp. NBRC 16547]GLW96993.1 transcriptional regulator [Microtetraspora sp. NBRC 16547]
MTDEPTHMPGSPRVRFGSEMRRLREAAQLSQAAVASRLGCTQTQVSRLEIAKRAPSKSDAEKLDQIFGLTDRQYFVGLYQRIISRPGGPGWFMGWVEEIEPSALVLRSWDPLLIPGLLQTEAYAREIFAQEPRISPQEIDERVRARMQRQQILDRDDPPSLLVMMDAGVLRRPVGTSQVMREQLDHLLVTAQRPAISLQVVDSKCLPGLLGAFMIAEMPNGPDTVHADSPAEGQVSADHDLVLSLWNRYEAIRLWAYPEHVSLQMIKEVKQEWT